MSSWGMQPTELKSLATLIAGTPGSHTWNMTEFVKHGHDVLGGIAKERLLSDTTSPETGVRTIIIGDQEHPSVWCFLYIAPGSAENAIPLAARQYGRVILAFQEMYPAIMTEFKVDYSKRSTLVAPQEEPKKPGDGGDSAKKQKPSQKPVFGWPCKLSGAMVIAPPDPPIC